LRFLICPFFRNPAIHDKIGLENDQYCPGISLQFTPQEIERTKEDEDVLGKGKMGADYRSSPRDRLFNSEIHGGSRL